MDPNNATAFLQKGLHVVLGATSSVVESLQDSQKREENLSQLNLGPDELMQIWAEKGEVTESEARTFMDNLMAQYSPQSSDTPSDVGSTTPPAGSTVDPVLQQNLKDLTAEITNTRVELENMTNP